MSETRQRNRRSGHEADEWAAKIQRSLALHREGLEWDVISERLRIEADDMPEIIDRVKKLEAASLQPVECFGLMRVRGRYVPVRVAVAGADVEPLTGRTPQGALSTTGYALALGRLEQELRASARRSLQGKAVVP